MSRRPSHKAWPGSWHPALPALTGTARPGSRPPPRPDRPSSSVVTRHAPYGIRRPVHAYDISRFRGDGVISHSKYPHCHGNMLRRDYFSRRDGRHFRPGGRPTPLAHTWDTHRCLSSKPPQSTTQGRPLFMVAPVIPTLTARGLLCLPNCACHTHHCPCGHRPSPSPTV